MWMVIYVDEWLVGMVLKGCVGNWLMVLFVVFVWLCLYVIWLMKWCYVCLVVWNVCCVV